jgi:hypothetical protein
MRPNGPPLDSTAGLLDGLPEGFDGVCAPPDGASIAKQQTTAIND